MKEEKDIEFCEENGENTAEKKAPLSVAINVLRWIGACLPLFISMGSLIEEHAFVALIHLIGAFLISPLSTRYLKWLGIRISTRLYVLIVAVWLIISGFFFFRMIEEEPDTDYETQTEDVF